MHCVIRSAKNLKHQVSKNTKSENFKREKRECTMRAVPLHSKPLTTLLVPLPRRIARFLCVLTLITQS